MTDEIPQTPTEAIISGVPEIPVFLQATPAPAPPAETVTQIVVQPDPLASIPTSPETGVSVQENLPADTSAFTTLEAFLTHIPAELHSEYVAAMEKLKSYF